MTERIEAPPICPTLKFNGAVAVPSERPRESGLILPDQVARLWAVNAGGDPGFATAAGAGAGDALYFDAAAGVRIAPPPPEHPAPGGPVLLPVYADRPAPPGTALAAAENLAAAAAAVGPLYGLHYAVTAAAAPEHALMECDPSALFAAAAAGGPPDAAPTCIPHYPGLFLASFPAAAAAAPAGRHEMAPAPGKLAQQAHPPVFAVHLRRDRAGMLSPSSSSSPPIAGGMADAIVISDDEGPAVIPQKGGLKRHGPDKRQRAALAPQRAEDAAPAAAAVPVAGSAAAASASGGRRTTSGGSASGSGKRKRANTKMPVVAPPLPLLRQTTLRLARSREDLTSDIQSTGSRTEDEDWSRWKEPDLPATGFFCNEPADQAALHDSLAQADAVAAATDVETSSGEDSVVQISDESSESEEMCCETTQDFETRETPDPARAATSVIFSALDSDTLLRYQEVFDLPVPKAKGAFGCPPTHEQLASLAAEHFENINFTPCEHPTVGREGEEDGGGDVGDATERYILDVFVEAVQTDRRDRRTRTLHKGWRRAQSVDLEDVELPDASSDDLDEYPQPRRHPIRKRPLPSAGFWPATFHRTGARGRSAEDGAQSESDGQSTERPRRMSRLRGEARMMMMMKRKGRPKKPAAAPAGPHVVAKSSPLKKSTFLSPTPSPPPCARGAAARRRGRNARSVVLDYLPPSSSRPGIMWPHAARPRPPPGSAPRKAAAAREPGGGSAPHGARRPGSRRPHAAEERCAVPGGRVCSPRARAKEKEAKSGGGGAGGLFSKTAAAAAGGAGGGGEDKRTPPSPRHKYALSDSAGSLRCARSPSALAPWKDPPPPPHRSASRGERRVARYDGGRRLSAPDPRHTDGYSASHPGPHGQYHHRRRRRLREPPRPEFGSDGVVFVPGIVGHGLHPGGR